MIKNDIRDSYVFERSVSHVLLNEHEVVVCCWFRFGILDVVSYSISSRLLSMDIFKIAP